VFRVHTAGRPVDDGVNFERLAAETDEYTAADIEGICREAALQAARDYVEESSSEQIKTPPEDIVIDKQDFRGAMDRVEPTGEVGESSESPMGELKRTDR